MKKRNWKVFSIIFATVILMSPISLSSCSEEDVSTQLNSEADKLSSLAKILCEGGEYHDDPPHPNGGQADFGNELWITADSVPSRFNFRLKVEQIGKGYGLGGLKADMPPLETCFDGNPTIKKRIMGWGWDFDGGKIWTPFEIGITALAKFKVLLEVTENGLPYMTKTWYYNTKWSPILAGSGGTTPDFIIEFKYKNNALNISKLQLFGMINPSENTEHLYWVANGSSMDTTTYFKTYLSLHTTPGGSITPSSYGNSWNYDRNAQVTLTAVPSPGYVFTGWSGDQSGSQLVQTIVMDKDRDITANFQYSPVNSVSLADNGSFGQWKMSNGTWAYFETDVIPTSDGYNLYTPTSTKVTKRILIRSVATTTPITTGVTYKWYRNGSYIGEGAGNSFEFSESYTSHIATIKVEAWQGGAKKAESTKIYHCIVGAQSIP